MRMMRYLKLYCWSDDDTDDTVSGIAIAIAIALVTNMGGAAGWAHPTKILGAHQ